jgi:uncharacterized membrane protein
MSIDGLVTAIHDTTLSGAIRGDIPGTEWLFPIIETIHVLCITVLFGSISMVDLRLLGLTEGRLPFTKLYRELIPWTWGAFAGAVVFGTILATGKIEDYAHSPVFLAKFGLMALAGLNMLVFQGMYRHVDSWDKVVPAPPGARAAGAISLVLWIGVIVCGRWVGFVT